MGNDYMKDLEIDEHELHMECMIQPQLYMKYAEMYAAASKTRSKLKGQLEILESELDNKYRLELANASTKVTEKMILSMIRQDPGYQDLQGKLLNAEFEENIYKDAKMAFQDRKLQLGNLTDLFISGYFAKPTPKTKTENIRRKHQEKLAAEREE
jgi:hypothetical protein